MRTAKLLAVLTILAAPAVAMATQAITTDAVLQVPEPESLSLLAVGLAGMIVTLRRKRK